MQQDDRDDPHREREPVHLVRCGGAEAEREQGGDLGGQSELVGLDASPMGDGEQDSEDEQPDRERDRAVEDLDQEKPGEPDHREGPDSAEEAGGVRGAVLLALESDQERKPEGDRETGQLGR